MTPFVNNLGLRARSWRYLVNGWTVFLFAVIIWDFMTHNGIARVVGPVCAVYAGALALYSAEKEFERWNDYHLGRHPGELYVMAWTALMVLLFLGEIFLEQSYSVPAEVTATYIGVIGILAITKRSKDFYHSKREGASSQ